jgi:hypothetical protein
MMSFRTSLLHALAPHCAPRPGGRAGTGRIVALAALLALGLAGCGPGASSDLLFAASVNGHGIPLSAYQHLVAISKTQAIQQGQSVSWQSPAGRTALAGAQRNAIDFLVTAELIHEQVRQQHITIDPKAVAKQEQDLNTLLATRIKQSANDPARLEVLRSYTSDFVTIFAREEVEQSALVAKLQLPVADVRVIVVAARKDADDLIGQLSRGADFGQLAQQKSLDQGSAQQGGAIGKVYAGQLPAEIDQRIFGANGESPDKPLSMPYQGRYLILQVTQDPQHRTAPLASVGNPNQENTIFQGWLNDFIRPAADIQEYVAIDPAPPATTSVGA